MYNLISILKPRIHPKSPSRSKRMSSIANKENILVNKFISQQSLQLPFSHMNNLEIILNIKILLTWKYSRNKFPRRIDLRKIQKRLIIRHLQHKGPIAIWMINQNGRHFLIPHKMQHGLLVLLFNPLRQLPTLKMYINNIKQLMLPLHPNTQLISQRRMYPIG